MSALGENRVRIEGPSGNVADVDASGRLSITEAATPGPVFACGGPGINLIAGQQASFQLKNPAGSGMVILLAVADIYCSEVGAVEFYEDATSTGTLRTPFDIDRSVAAVSAAEFRSGQGVLSEGTLLDATGRVDPDDHWNFDGTQQPYVIPPGKSIAVRYTAPVGLGATATVYCTAKWVEKPL